ncbi:MAG: quinol:cytochrome C oxidoreductase [Chitinophagaceae bacterium]|nr:quinol:cytochrome C oxidoreductase [Chitinophagaceae bacterium]MBK8312437.1 quinol:cytochrome C oxidoreductase [Chitinophagaceae bacterium]MBK8606278.1 quinol:cytochrome C oxidoreductase [Chitinophagaceae bacterium]MBP6478459.1 quinol:cytochrome C oxidoreductase [Chitinophagaceae bacterium]MBP7315623.1 quinol:cytochrome C oxidoreductase [Chitinophagaceae bacterium]
MVIREKYTVPKRFNTIAITLMVIGILAIVGLYATHGSKSDATSQARFWGSLLQNSVYFLLVVNAAMFFICALTLAWGGWQMSFRRVSEAISACVPVVGTICGVILLLICFGNNHEIYHWTDTEHVKEDAILNFKKGFLNKNFFAVMTVLTIVSWSLLGRKMRKLSQSIDNKPLNVEEGKKYIWNNTVWAAIYIVVFSLTVLSSIPWLWLMSIDAHWYSTMYSWYTFASTFVAGVALITLFVVFLKNNNYLELTNEEHLHDLGKFMFAFSIFWTYLWFSQFMLIWYANIPEETTYFKPRAQGMYSGIFWLMFIINFLAPLLIFMSRNSKRNYATLTFMSLLIIFGHWLDFFQMVFPGHQKEHVPMILWDFGVALGFVGLIMFVTARALSKAPLLAKNHPFIKESVIHHT